MQIIYTVDQMMYNVQDRYNNRFWISCDQRWEKNLKLTIKLMETAEEVYL